MTGRQQWPLLIVAAAAAPAAAELPLRWRKDIFAPSIFPSDTTHTHTHATLLLFLSLCSLFAAATPGTSPFVIFTLSVGCVAFAKKDQDRKESRIVV